jgi:DNA repair protein RecN (Recombination protein N)
MLTELRISNVAIIEQQSISFGGGLNVITGETGAGKSIVLHALELILGARPSPHLVRDGSDSMEVEAIFRLAEIPASTRAALPDIAQGDELVLSRMVNRSGRNKVFINGRLATVSVLEELCSRVVNICGQNQNVRLLDSAYHLQLIDGYADLDGAVERYRTHYGEWRALATSLAEMRARRSDQESRRGQLEDSLAELKAIELRPGIRAELEASVRKLGGSAMILERGNALLAELQRDDAAVQQVGGISAQLQELARIDPAVRELHIRAEGVRRELTEVERDLQRYLRGVSTDEEALLRLRDHLAEVARLERKYRTNDEGLLALRLEQEKSLREATGSADLLALEAQVEGLQRRVMMDGERLSKDRIQAAQRLMKAAARELAEVNMPECRLEPATTTIPPGPSGIDRIEFLVATNKGSELRPLRQIASGGELSRLTLVLMKLLRDRSGVSVLVFDEVDTGISGGVARAVGEKLLGLARESQVICITHLPQVASLADHHFLVKKGGKSTTKAEIHELVGDEKVNEIARMLAGYDITPASRASAIELLTSNPPSRT